MMTKIMYKVFKTFSFFVKESSLLHFNDLIILFSLTFYINDFFNEFKNFKD